MTKGSFDPGAFSQAFWVGDEVGAPKKPWLRWARGNWIERNRRLERKIEALANAERRRQEEEEFLQLIVAAIEKVFGVEVVHGSS
jgi:hypothetical protein